MPIKRGSQHICSTKKCWCAEVAKLTKMYKELKALRKEVMKSDKAAGSSLKTKNENLFEEDISACKCTLSMIQAQRYNTRDAMCSLKMFNEQLACQEEEICQTDNLMSELQIRICCAVNQSKQEETRRASQSIDTGEDAWKEAVTSECRDLDCLQRKMKELSQTIGARNSKASLGSELKQKQQKEDSQLLLDAVTRIEQCLKESKLILIEQTPFC